MARRVKRTSPTHPAQATVEVEMIVVFWVETGSQDDAEVRTSPVRSAPQKAGLRPVTVPLPAHADVLPVRQREAGDINGMGNGMLAAPIFPNLGANNVAERVGAEALYRH